MLPRPGCSPTVPHSPVSPAFRATYCDTGLLLAIQRCNTRENRKAHTVTRTHTHTHTCVHLRYYPKHTCAPSSYSTYVMQQHYTNGAGLQLKGQCDAQDTAQLPQGANATAQLPVHYTCPCSTNSWLSSASPFVPSAPSAVPPSAVPPSAPPPSAPPPSAPLPRSWWIHSCPLHLQISLHGTYLH